jgi:uncharacterized protein YkwD
MVNKAAVGVLGVVVIVSLLVGVLIGMQLAGGDTPAATTNGDDTTGETTAAPGTKANTTEANNTAAAAEYTPIDADQFNRNQIERKIAKGLNEDRESVGRPAFIYTDSTATELRSMARDHSKQMADFATVSHTVDNTSTADRYVENDLAGRCSFGNEDIGWVYNAAEDRNNEIFEVLGQTQAGQPYQYNGSTQFNANESAVADAIVREILDDEDMQESIRRKGPEHIGIGVEITQNGRVYVTGNICA